MKEFFTAFLGGTIVGAVTALLLAPKSGKETREDLKEIINNAEDVLKKKTDEIIEEGKKQLEKIKEKGHEIVEEGKKTIGKVKKAKES